MIIFATDLYDLYPKTLFYHVLCWGIAQINDMKIAEKYIITPKLYFEDNGIWKETNRSSIINPLCNQILNINEFFDNDEQLKIEYVLPPTYPYLDYDKMYENQPEHQGEDYNLWLDLGLEEEERMNDETDGFWGFEQDER